MHARTLQAVRLQATGYRTLAPGLPAGMDRRMCWLALCWWLGRGCLEEAGWGPAGDQQAAGLPRVDGYPWPKPHSYNTRWDKVNIQELLGSRRLLQHYFNCLMSRGPCPPDGRELRRAIPEALDNACAKCTKSQIEASIKVIRYLREYEPVKFEMLANKYDPYGVYRKRYLEPLQDDSDNSLNEQPPIEDNNNNNNNNRKKRRVKRLRHVT